MTFVSKGRQYVMRVPVGVTYGQAVDAFFIAHSLRHLESNKGEYVYNMIRLTKQLVEKATPTALKAASRAARKSIVSRSNKRLYRRTTAQAASPAEAFKQVDSD